MEDIVAGSSTPKVVPVIGGTREVDHTGKSKKDDKNRNSFLGAGKGNEAGGGPPITQMTSSAKLKFLSNQDSITWRQALYVFLEDEQSSRLAYIFGNSITFTILFSIVVICVETMEGPNHYADKGDASYAIYPFLASASTYDVLEIIFTIVFTGELVLRLIAAETLFFHGPPAIGPDEKRVLSKITPFFKSFMNWADIIAVAPFYILLAAGDLNSVGNISGMAKAVRSLRIFKLSRQFEGSEILGTAVANSVAPLGLPIFFFFLFTFVFGSLIFFVEPCYNHETCEFPDIFVSCYFAMVTMTTVGYGDISPTMFFSRVVASMVMLFGALFLSMPVAIVGSEFDAAWAKLEKEEGKDDETIKQELHEFEMRKKRLGVNLITRLHKQDAMRMSKLQAMDLIEKITNKVLNQETQNENAQMINDSRFYLYDIYLKISDHLNAIYDLLDEDTATLERLEWCLEVLSSCSTLMKKVTSVCGMAGKTDGMGFSLTSKIRATSSPGTAATALENGGTGSRNGTARSSGSNRGTGRRGGEISRGRRVSTRSFASLDDRPSSGRLSSGSGVTPASSGRFEGISSLMSKGGLGLTADKLAALQKAASNAHQGTFASVANVLGKGTDVGSRALKAANEEEKHFVKYICDAMYNDTNRDRLWLLLEVPQSGHWAGRLSNFMIVVILGSIGLFVMESVPQFTIYGEGTGACEHIVEMFCEEPSNMDRSANPACFQFNSTQKLRFGCEDADCFGVGNNFGLDYKSGGLDTTQNAIYYTCDPFKGNDEVNGRPFADQAMLPPINDFTWLHTSMNTVHDICYRPECNNDHYSFFDFTPLYFPLETFFAFVFTIEVLTRALASRNVIKFWLDPMNLLDVASVTPYYIEILISLGSSTPLDFTISGADSAGIMLLKILKVTRVFKMTRHFSGTMVLGDTFKRSMSKLYVPFFMLTVMTTVFALAFYVIEGGTSCYIGEECKVEWPDTVTSSDYYHEGQRVLVTEYGDGVSRFPDAIHSLFFVLVTITSVGYGDMVPLTMMGKSLSVLVMMFGTLYLSMPLTIVGGQFISSYKSMVETDKLFEKALRSVNNKREMSSFGEGKLSRGIQKRFKSFKQKMPPLMMATLESYSECRVEIKANFEILDRAISKAVLKIQAGEEGEGQRRAGGAKRRPYTTTIQ